VIRIPYSTSFRIPAPVLSVTVRNPNLNRPAVVLDAQIDTGADRTVVPAVVVTKLGLLPGGHLQFGGIGGVITLPVYYVSISIPGVMDFTIDAAGDDDETLVLLGRDVLNALHTHLDGPGRMLTLSAQPSATP
jgi:predicted aspartyl protease